LIHITTIGVPDIRSGSSRIRPDAEVLFGLALYLSLNAGTAVPREALLRIFWPGVADGDARHALRQLLYRLRKTSVPIDVDGAVLLIDRSSVVTDLDPILTVDDPATLTRDQMVGLDRVLSGYTPKISTEFSEWLDALRTQVESRYRRALMSLIAAARREGRWSDLEHWSQKCLRIDPLNEEATLARAEAAAMVGAKAEAMAILDDFVAELGERSSAIGLPAQLLRRRISEQVGQEATSSATPLIGRTREIAALTDRIEAVAHGTSAVIRIHGPSGIGKSRLGSEAVGIARLRGFSVASVRLAEPDSARPMSLMMDLAARLLVLPGALGCSPEAMATVRRLCEKSAGKIEDGTPASMQVVREQTRRALIELLEALTDERPLFIWVDNADYVDPTSQALLAELVAGTRDRKVVWQLCGSRLERVSYITDEPPGSAVVKITGLSLNETTQLAQLVKPMSGSAADAEARGAWLQSATGGNPLFVRELAAQSVRPQDQVETPPSLREVVRRRLARLSAGATRALRACAMMGAHASIGALIEVLECEPSALHSVLEELDQEGLVANDAASPLWVHEIIGQEVLDQSSPAVIRLLHFQVGTAISKRATNSWSPRLAWDAAGHLAAAGETAQAVSLLVQTANHQLAIGMPAAAASTFRRAAETTENKEETAHLQVDEIRSLGIAGDWNSVRDRLEAMTSSPRAALSSDEHDELALLGFRGQWHLGVDPTEVYSLAVSFARRKEVAPIHRARAVALAAVVGDNIQHIDYTAIVDELVASIETLSTERLLPLLESKAIVAFTRNSPEEAAELFREIAESQRRARSIDGRARALLNLTFPLELLGLTSEAVAAAEEAYTLSRDFRMASIAARAADRLSGILFDANQLLESEEWILRAQRWNDEVSDPTALKSIYGQRLRLFLHARLGGLSNEHLEGRLRTVTREEIRRVRLRDIAVLMFWRSSEGDLEGATTLLRELEAGFESVAYASRPDYIHAAVVWTAKRAGVEAADSLVRRLTRAKPLGNRPWYRDAVETTTATELFRDLAGRRSISPEEITSA
jgi:DNA-binding SARP family transcriptional activator/tetratricopeptide (TPR) repeat protein